MNIRAHTANDIWILAYRSLLESDAMQPSGWGHTIEVLHYSFKIESIRDRWILARTPALNPAFALAEVIWILTGSNDSEIVNHWNPKLPQYAGDTEYYHGAYGHRLRRHFGFDQLRRAADALVNFPISRQVVLQIWDPRIDMPSHEGKAPARDIPCNLCSLLKVREDRLEWMQIMRSNDIILGLPHNIVQFTSLQEVLAGWIGLEPGDYNHLSDSLHLYTTDRNNVAVDDKLAIPTNTDKLNLPYHMFSKNISHLNAVIQQMVSGTLTDVDLQSICSDNELSQPYNNILSILAADHARRCGWRDLIDEVLQVCNSEVLLLAWHRWYNRIEGKS